MLIVALVTAFVVAQTPSEPPKFFACSLALEGIIHREHALKRLTELGVSTSDANDLVAACDEESPRPGDALERALAARDPAVLRFVEAALAWEHISIFDKEQRKRIVRQLGASGSAYVEGLGHEGAQRAELLLKAATFDKMSSEKAACAVDALISNGQLKEAEHLVKQPRASDKPRLVELMRARIAARRGDAARAEALWRSAPARRDGDYLSEYPCRFDADGGCNLAADLLAAGKPEDALRFGKDCRAHAAARAANGENFEALVKSLDAHDGPSDPLLEPRLLVGLGRPDVARRRLAVAVERCRAGATYFDCKAIDQFVRSLPPHAPKLRSGVAARLAADPLHKRYPVSIVKSPRGQTETWPSIPGARAVLFLSPSAKERVAITSGHFLEPQKAPGPALVILFSDDGGATWSKPIFTALRTTGWVPVDPSTAAAFDGENIRLPLDQVRLPALQTDPRRRDDRVLTLRVSDLKRDGDGDGLPDVTEELFASDASAKDSDGDGLRDSDDPQPLETHGTASRATPFLAEVLKQRNELNEVLFVSDEPLPDLPRQIVRFTFDEFELYRRKHASERADEIDVVFDSSGERALVMMNGPHFFSSDLVTRNKDGVFEVKGISGGVY